MSIGNIFGKCEKALVALKKMETETNTVSTESTKIEINDDACGSIPKVIHYVWVGGNPEPDDVIACKESWKKFLPDFEIKRWDESNFDLGFCEYIAEAYRLKKYAFVSDVIRTYVLHEYGGVYFDTDLELLRTPTELFDNDLVLGYETEFLLETCCIAAKPNSEIIGKLLEQYKTEKFVCEYGSYGKTINHRLSEIVFDKIGKKYLPDANYKFDGISLYNSGVFTARQITEESASVHHFGGSWKNPVELTKMQSFMFRVRYKLLKVFSRVMGNNAYLDKEHRLWTGALEKTAVNKASNKKIYRKF